MKTEYHSGVENLPADAIALLVAQEKVSVQLGADWYQNLERTVLPSLAAKAGYHVLRDDSRVLAVLPVLLARGPSVRALSNFYTAIYSPALAPDISTESLTLLLRNVRRHHRGAPSLMLSPMDRESQAYSKLVQAMPLAGYRTYEFYCFGNWYLHPKSGWQEYLAGRDSKMRNTIKRMRTKLAADGAVIEVLRDRANAGRALEAFERVYATSWKSAEPFKDFVPGLVDLCVRRGWLRMGVIWMGDRPIAAQLWIVSEGKAEIYKVAYDTEFKHHSPGTVLTAALLEHVIDVDRVSEVDYLIGDDAYKKTWMTGRRERWGLIGYDPLTVRGLSAWAKESFTRMVKRWMGRD